MEISRQDFEKNLMLIGISGEFLSKSWLKVTGLGGERFIKDGIIYCYVNTIP